MFARKFHDVEYFEVEFLFLFFHIPCFHYKLEGTITNISKKTSI
jgi:hypothetical protein